MSRLKLGFSHVNRHIFKFFLHNQYFTELHSSLLHELAKMIQITLNIRDNEIMEGYILLRGSSKYNNKNQNSILNNTANFILKLERFSGQLLQKLVIFVIKLSL